jgi:purine-binding chemotaxis protein CheW
MTTTMLTTAGRPAVNDNSRRELVTLTLAGHCVGVPVATVQDILGAQQLTRVPLAPPEVAGVLNLRGRIVTAIDLRRRLGIAADRAATAAMNVVIEHHGELYSLLVDEVGEVLDLPKDRFEPDVSTLNPAWREIADGIYRLEERLLVVLDVGRVLSFATPA